MASRTGNDIGRSRHHEGFESPGHGGSRTGMVRDNVAGGGGGPPALVGALNYVHSPVGGAADASEVRRVCVSYEAGRVMLVVDGGDPAGGEWEAGSNAVARGLMARGMGSGNRVAPLLALAAIRGAGSGT